jgi:hypothetical protein
MRQSPAVPVVALFARIPQPISRRLETELFRRRVAGQKISRGRLLAELLERGLPDVSLDDALKQAVGG